MARPIFELLRRRIAPIVVVLAFGVLMVDTCGKHPQIHATIVFDLGPASETVARVEADVLVADEPVATFARDRAAAGVMGNPTFKATLPDRDATLVIRLHVPGRVIQARRRIVADEGAVVTVQLARELQ